MFINSYLDLQFTAKVVDMEYFKLVLILNNKIDEIKNPNQFKRSYDNKVETEDPLLIQVSIEEHLGKEIYNRILMELEKMGFRKERINNKHLFVRYIREDFIKESSDVLSGLYILNQIIDNLRR